ncbi:hypothetical protein [Sphingomicrobium aestuariivivum]|uniref:hypothetical protein n=1 Tax=Sphingomicrobium aestuariivivum TaxID=1582356 RepID=UPI001FD67547|nr:hypothetical protein [Sphingomicrobium aestuariivivum]MCJ8190845.1 hypothetical protein [Sphingomicrobium aestuariivivum]
MKKLIPAFAPLVLLAACARTEPVSEEELSVVEPVETPTLVEDGETAALPVSDMAWQVTGNAALLGPEGADPALSIACGDDDNGLILTRYGVEGSGSAGTLTIVGNGSSARVPVVAAEAEGEDRFDWTATLARGELANSIAEAFAGEAPVNITATSVEPIVVAGSDELRGLLDRCAVGGVDAEREIGDAPLVMDEEAAAAE